jgi:hypothetical protein
MFQANEKHLQPGLLSHVETLSEKKRERLEQSWAGVFFSEVFCRIPEAVLAVLYCDVPSRPNVAVNVLLGLELLKSGFGWSDEELYDHFQFDMQVRYALGIHDLNTEDFELRTLYNFRSRLREHHLEHGVNLVERCIAQITAGQVTAFKLNTRLQRMDSTFIVSNIYDASRLHLLIEGVQRLAALLSEVEMALYAERLAPYTSRSAEQIVSRLPGRQASAEVLQQMGALLDSLLTTLAATQAEAQHPDYVNASRLFHDNYRIVEQRVPVHVQRVIETRSNDEIASGALQSFNDPEATYRRKQNKGYKGYVTNVTQTCAPENPLQLITLAQVAPNNVADTILLCEALPVLLEATELTTLYTDGGYGGEQSDLALQATPVTQIATGIKGATPTGDKYLLADFTLECNETGIPVWITCPANQRVVVLPGKQPASYVANFATVTCSSCPLLARCRVLPAQRAPDSTLRFTLTQFNAAQRRQRMRALLASGKNPRAAIEAVVRCVKHPFRQGKVPVRGRFRTTVMVVLSAAMVNMRAIHRYLDALPRAPLPQLTT